MADDSNKLQIEISLESGQFQTSINGVKQSLQQTGEQGKESFGQLGASIIVINEALELGKKALEAWHQMMELALDTEKIKNQQAAFTSFANSLNVDSKALVESVKHATSGTVTELQAMNASMDLLQAGVNAKQIPALTKLAEQIVATGHHGETFEQVISALHQSMIMGSGRPMNQWIEGAGKMGDRQTVLNDILTNGEKKFGDIGNAIDLSQSKIKAKSDEAYESVKRFFGGIAQDISFSLFADNADKAVDKVKGLEKQLASFKEQQASGVGKIEMWDSKQGMVWLDTAKAIEAQEKLIADAKGKVAENTKKEADAQSEVNDKLATAKTFATELLPAQKQRAEATAAQIAVTQKLAEMEKSETGASIQAYQDVTTAKKAEIERFFLLEKQNAEAGATDANKLAKKLVDIERNKFDAIRALRVDDTRVKLAQDAAIVNMATSNMHLVENAQATHLKVLNDAEMKRYQVETERIRTAGYDNEKFNKQIEANELAHQKNLKSIKDTYAAVNLNNLKAGFHSALDSMEKDQGNFAKMTEKMTLKTKGIMVNSFVEAAKGHGNAMELMKQQFLEMIGTQMIETGIFMMFDAFSTFPIVKVPELAMGAASVAAGSALVGASGSSAPSASAAGSGAGPTSPYQSATTPGTSGGAATNKQASIVINGDFLNSRETANHLADILRTNSDITDYTITAQGKSYI